MNVLAFIAKKAPKNKADLAFIQNMIHTLADDGVLAVVLPHGVLFRGGSELEIRKTLIEKNYLDTVIGLPANLFFGTAISTSILVFKKCRKRKVNEEKDNILFIDASKEFNQEGKKNVLTEENIEKIINTYGKREKVEHYSYLASLEEIKEKEYNLNIASYIAPL